MRGQQVSSSGEVVFDDSDPAAGAEKGGVSAVSTVAVLRDGAGGGGHQSTVLRTGLLVTISVSLAIIISLCVTILYFSSQVSSYHVFFYVKMQ